MGKAAGGTEAKKKKKGRPSLLDVQKRLLKQQKLHHSPAETPNSHSHSDTHSNPSQRSNRRYPNSDWSHQALGLISGDDDDDERIEKKRRPLLGLDSESPCLLANDNYEEEKVSKVTDTGDVHGLREVSGPTTPLPDKKLLAFILDRLQKKDTHGVFSEPVDPEELPDYHDMIKHPMDFGTVRKKLEEGAYANLEQFEKDIFLICSNAMQYNAPDTIFFKQARSMQDIAQKDFENLRQESDDSELEQPKETPKVVRRGRPPGSGKGSKKFNEANKSAAFGIGTEASSDTIGNNSFLSSTYNLRRAPDPCILQSADSTVNAFRGTTPNRENQNTWFAEFDKEFPASVLRRVMKEGKKLFTSEDNRRESYRQNLFGQEQSVFPPEMAAKQLALVGFHSEHAYARSVAQFGADLGPVAQRIASKKIASAVPCGMDVSLLRLIAEKGTSDRNHQLQTKNVVTTPPNPNSNYASIVEVAGSSDHVGSHPVKLEEEEDSEVGRRLTSQSKLTSPSTSLGDVPFLQSQQNPIGSTRYDDDCSGGPSEVTRVAASNGCCSTAPHPMSVNSIDLEVQNFFGEFQQVSSTTTVKHEFPERCLGLRTVEQNPQHGPVSCEPNGRFLVGASSQQPELGLQL